MPTSRIWASPAGLSPFSVHAPADVAVMATFAVFGSNVAGWATLAKIELFSAFSPYDFGIGVTNNTPSPVTNLVSHIQFGTLGGGPGFQSIFNAPHNPPVPGSIKDDVTATTAGLDYVANSNGLNIQGF